MSTRLPIRSTLAILTLAVLLVVADAPVPISAGAPPPALTVTVNPPSGPTGTSGTITITGAQPGDPITLIIGAGITNLTADATGAATFTTTFFGQPGDVIPISAQAGFAPPFSEGSTTFTITTLNLLTASLLINAGTNNDLLLIGDGPPQVMTTPVGDPLTPPVTVTFGRFNDDPLIDFAIADPLAPTNPVGSGQTFLGDCATGSNPGGDCLNLNGRRWGDFSDTTLTGPEVGSLTGDPLVINRSLGALTADPLFIDRILISTQPGSSFTTLVPTGEEIMPFASFTGQAPPGLFCTPFPSDGLFPPSGTLTSDPTCPTFPAFDPPSFTGGVHVAAADINGDGRDDLITGAPGPNGGNVTFYPGDEQGFMQSPSTIFTPTEASPNFGGSISAGGQFVTFTGLEGFPQLRSSQAADVPFCNTGCLAVSAPAASAGEDSSVWLIGPNYPRDAETVNVVDGVDWAARISGIPDGERGVAVELGDLNGDGILDLVIGVPGGDGAPDTPGSDQAGVIYIVLGPLQGGALGEMAIRRYVGADAGDLFGGDIEIFDLNEDGIVDLHVTARFYQPTRTSAEAGALFTFLGAPPEITSTSVAGGVTTITGANLDANVFIDGARVPVLSATATEVQVLGTGTAVEVRGAFGTATGGRSVTLLAGWNLVGWTGESPVADATASIAGSFSALFTWDAATQEFRSYRPGLPATLNTLSELHRGDAVWIRATRAATWQQPSFGAARDVALLPGFNLAMWTGPDGTTVPEAIASLGDAVTLLLTWDAAAQQFRSYNPSLPASLNTLTTLNYGDGMWIRVSRAVTWEQPAP